MSLESFAQISLAFFFFPLTWAQSRWSLGNKLNRREQIKNKKWKSLQIKVDPEKTINWPFVCRQHMLKKSMVGSCGKSHNNCRQSWPKGENSQADEERRLPGTWRTKDAEGNVWNLRPSYRDVACTHGFCEENERKCINVTRVFLIISNYSCYLFWILDLNTIHKYLPWG